MGINRGQGFDRCGVFTTDQHAIRGLEVGDRRALRQKFWIRQHREAGFGCITVGVFALSRLQNCLHCRGGPHRQGALFHHDRVPLSMSGHGACRCLHPAQIARLTSPQPFGLRGCIHREKDHVGGCNLFSHLGAEEQIATAATPHHRIQTGFIDGQPA